MKEASTACLRPLLFLFAFKHRKALLCLLNLVPEATACFTLKLGCGILADPKYLVYQVGRPVAHGWACHPCRWATLPPAALAGEQHPFPVGKPPCGSQPGKRLFPGEGRKLTEDTLAWMIPWLALPLSPLLPRLPRRPRNANRTPGGGGGQAPSRNIRSSADEQQRPIRPTGCQHFPGWLPHGGFPIGNRLFYPIECILNNPLDLLVSQ